MLIKEAGSNLKGSMNASGGYILYGEVSCCRCFPTDDLATPDATGTFLSSGYYIVHMSWPASGTGASCVVGTNVDDIAIQYYINETTGSFPYRCAWRNYKYGFGAVPPNTGAAVLSYKYKTTVSPYTEGYFYLIVQCKVGSSFTTIFSADPLYRDDFNAYGETVFTGSGTYADKYATVEYVP